MPPWMLPFTPDLVWRLRRLTPRTATRCCSGSTRSTTPRLPLSFPPMTSTLSPLRMSSGRRCPLAQPSRTSVARCLRSTLVAISDHLRREADDLHEVALAQLSSHRAEDARAAWVVLRCDEHRCVLVEADVASVRTLVLLGGAHHHRTNDVTLLHLGVRLRHLDGADDDVADRRVFAIAAAEYADAEQLARAAVVGHLEHRFLLDHVSEPSPGLRRHASESPWRWDGSRRCARDRRPHTRSPRRGP